MILDDFSLQGKSAIITGASRGLGEAMARGLAEAGANVALVARREATLQSLVQEFQALGVQALAIAADVTEYDQIQGIVDKALEAFGQVDILINNAGRIARSPAVDYTPRQWDEVIDTNLRAAFFVAQAAGRVMIEQGHGSIISTASLLSHIGVGNIPAYAASKGGIASLTKALAVEWAPHNVRVNAIAPGYFRTKLTTALQESEQKDAWILERTPLGRWGDPRDLAGLAVFLASDASSYITGQIIYCDGGWTAG